MRHWEKGGHDERGGHFANHQQQRGREETEREVQSDSNLQTPTRFSARTGTTKPGKREKDSLSVSLHAIVVYDQRGKTRQGRRCTVQQYSAHTGTGYCVRVHALFIDRCWGKREREPEGTGTNKIEKRLSRESRLTAAVS